MLKLEDNPPESAILPTSCWGQVCSWCTILATTPLGFLEIRFCWVIPSTCAVVPGARWVVL